MPPAFNVPPDLVIENCRIMSPRSRITSIALTAGKITQIGKGIGGGERLNAGGRIVTPGLIDLHVQGAGGADVLDGSQVALETISRTCARFGVTSFLATTVFHTDMANPHIAAAAEAVGQDLGGSAILGIHLEGPFISPQKRGMINPESICLPDTGVLDLVLELSRGTLRMMTLAPELPGNGGIINELGRRRIVPSFGHSNASYEEALLGIRQGISHVTHLFNAMPQIHHRHPGPLLAILESGLTAQLITDGVHVHPAVVRWIVSMMGEDRIVPITDGLRAMGLPDGRYFYDGFEFESLGGTARYHDGTLIGTALGMNAVLGRLCRFANCEMDAAIRMATANPARLLGLDSTKGSIDIGKDADLAIWDGGFRVWATLVGGKIVHKASSSGAESGLK